MGKGNDDSSIFYQTSIKNFCGTKGFVVSMQSWSFIEWVANVYKEL